MIDILTEICEIDEISEETFKIYQHLYESTKKYISETLKTVEGQRKLLNTYSMIRIKDLDACFKNYDSDNVIKKFIEEKGRFDSFIMLTWKILFNINCNEFDKHIISSNKEYIQFDFPGEINNVQIMTSALSGRVTNDLTRIFERIQTQKEKPKKWYFKNSRKGILNYSMDISQIKQEHNTYEIDVIDYSEKFYLECLSCIKIDQDEFNQRDNCSKCIFNENCVEGKAK